MLEYLSSHNNVIRLNAAGYLQHLTFNHNENKRIVRELGGIPVLVDLLRSDIPEIQVTNSCCPNERQKLYRKTPADA